MQVLLGSLSATTSEWLPDTGATSHMIPHRDWFRKYEKHEVPIKLANGAIVWSAGIGTVRIQPSQKSSREIEFTRVLHVPSLSSCLFSVLYLTKHKGFIVTILPDRILFERDKTTVFTASISVTSNSALFGWFDRLCPPSCCCRQHLSHGSHPLVSSFRPYPLRCNQATRFQGSCLWP